MKKLVIFFAAVCIIGATSAFAADQSSGCGAGWYVLKKNSLVSSTLRSTTNGIFFNSTFGMTFGTSNCAKHSIVMKEKEAQYFAETNRDILEIEMAQGNGEYLNAFAQTMGCQKPEFIRTVQQNYEKIFSHQGISATEMLENVRKESTSICLTTV